MTNLEFSDQFDVLYNNIMSNLAPGLDEYEKSVFLTKALDEIVKAYFNPRLNKPQQGFDDAERRQIDFSMLIKLLEDTTLENALFDTHSNSKAVNIPTDALMIINEMAIVTRGTNSITLLVLPIQYTEYTRLMSKPFKRPLKWQAWRLINNSVANKGDIVVGNNDNLIKYIVRYIKRPRPIILSDLEGVTIGADDSSNMVKAGTFEEGTTYFVKDGNSYIQTTVTQETFDEGTYYIKGTPEHYQGNAETSCELDPILHEEILLRAVELAKAAYTGDLNSQLALGLASQTNMGIVAQSR